MIRKDIQDFMTKRNIKSIGLVLNESDELGTYCSITGGILMDYTGHRVPIKKDVWGAVVYKNGQPVKMPWNKITELKDEILYRI